MPPRSDEALHLRVPAAGLVAEVHAGLEQVTHGYDCQGSAFLGSIAQQPAGRGRNLAQRPRHPHPSWSPGRGTERGKCSRQASARARSSPAARSSGSGAATSIRSPPKGWSKASRAAGGTAVRARDRPRRRRPGRRRPEGRSPRGGRGSGASGRLERHLEQGARTEPFDQLEPRDRIPRRRGVERMARAVDPVAADRRLDPPRPGPWRPKDERQVDALDETAPDRLLEACVRLVRASDHEHARRVAVETVDDARPISSPPAASSASRPCTSVPVSWPAAGWTTMPAGLSTTSRCSSSQRTRRSIASATGADTAGGSSTATSSPPRAGGSSPGAPSTSTAPSAISQFREPARPDLRVRGERAIEPVGLSDAKTESGQPCASLLHSVGSRERREQGRHADDDEDVGEVERGPEAQVEEVGHVAEPDAVEQVREAAAQHEAERDRQHRMAGAGASEEHEHPDDGERRQRDHDRRRAREEPEGDPRVVHVVDREGPAISTSSPRLSVCATTCLVSWSAPTAAPAMAASPATGAGRRRAGARPRAPAAGHGSTSRRGCRPASPPPVRLARSPLLLPRVVDAQRRPRDGLEPLDRDLLAAHRRCRTRPTRPGPAPPRPAAAGRARPPRAPRRARGRRSRWPCRRDGCRRSTRAVRRSRPSATVDVVVAIVRCRARLLLQVVPEPRGVDRHRASSPAEASRRSTSPGSTPASSTTLSREPSPRRSTGSARDCEGLREQREHGVVRLAALRRRCDAHLPRLAVPSHHARPARGPGATRSRSWSWAPRP